MNTEQLKQEAVKRAYGEYWENVKNNLTQSNWFKSKEVLGDCANTKIFSKFPNIEWECMNNYDPIYCYYFRPKSISGLENNNGWNKVTGFTDLPKENGIYLFINKDNVIEPFVVGKSDYYGKLTESEFIIRYFSYYQKIVLPNLPLY